MNGGSVAVPVTTLGTYLLMADEPMTPHDVAPEDRELLRRIGQGEIERFADLIRLHQRQVSRIVARRVPADRVEEVVHDVFVRAYFGLARFSDQVSLDHWLAGIAVRTCYDFWRARKRDAMPVSALTGEHHRWIEQALAPKSEEMFQEHVRKEEAADVLEWALAHLSPENRAVLTLVHLDGYSVREAANLLGWSVVNVKVRAHRARQALRRLLDGITQGSPS